MRTVVVAVAAFAAAIAVVGAAIAVVDVAAPPRLAVVFGSDRDDTLGIWAASADGRIVKLATGVEPLPSPDGRMILYRPDFRKFSTRVVDADGRRSRELASGVVNAHWSPDSSRVALLRNNLWVIDADGRDERELAVDVDEMSWSPDGRWLAFASAGESRGLFVAAPPAGASRPLTKPGAAEPSWPDWSPDGSLIAYVADASIHVMGADGSAPTRLTSAAEGEANRPAWSPDGRRIAFSRERDGDWDLWVMDANGANLVRLTSGAADDGAPTWSPDGTRLAFARAPGRGGIFAIDASGGPVRRLTPAGDVAQQPHWSPDGSLILYSSGSSIAVIRPDGSGSRTLLPGQQPRWSRDGSQIAFRRADRLYVARADGMGAVALETGKGGGQPTWAPSGELAFTAPRGADIGLVRVADGALVPVTNDSLVEAHPSWAPGGGSIAFTRGGDLVVYHTGSLQERVVARGVDQLAWSPRGLTLAFRRGGALGRVGADGSGERMLARGGVVEWQWSPHGAAIAYAARPRKPAPTELYVVAAADGAVRRLTRSRAGEDSFDPAWSPDGRWIAYTRCRSDEPSCGPGAGSSSADVYLTSATGGQQRQLVPPIPAGSYNAGPRWFHTGTLATVQPPQPRLVALRPAAVVRTSGPPQRLSARGTDVAVATAGPSGASTQIATWTPRRRRVVAHAAFCGGEVVAVAATGTQIAWIDRSGEVEASSEAAYGHLAEPVATSERLYVHLRRPRPVSVRCAVGAAPRPLASGENEMLGTVLASRSALLFDTWRSRGRGAEHIVWRTTDRRPKQLAAVRDRLPGSASPAASPTPMTSGLCSSRRPGPCSSSATTVACSGGSHPASGRSKRNSTLHGSQ